MGGFHLSEAVLSEIAVISGGSGLPGFAVEDSFINHYSLTVTITLTNYSLVIFVSIKFHLELLFIVIYSFK